ncbi:hypothetical protein A8M77_03540 [Variovorax sp. JS1663]|nr:hypothetical protein A8M77_03540 [Variovorax sp. JS1663]
MCGSVGVEDWSHHVGHAEFVEARFLRTYCDRDDHRHIHGANLGVAGDAYVRAGGFSEVARHEDVALVEALASTGARIAWSAKPRVVTSARRDARAQGGFGDALLAAVALGMALPQAVPA